MLLQFSVENFASIRDKVIINLEPSVDKEHEENILSKEKYKALNMISIYGSNGAGKTSICRAMTMALIILRASNVRQINELIPVVPFKFDEITLEKPSKFEFIFVANDGKKYIYGFSANSVKIYEEYLYCYKTAKPSLIFERIESEYRFSRSEKKYMDPVVRMNTDNKLFLATATTWNVESTAVPYRWLAEGIDTYTNDGSIANIALEMYRINEQQNVEFVKSLLRDADINISDIKVESKKLPKKSGISGIMIDGQWIIQQENYEIKIETGHKVTTKDSKEKTYSLSLNEESLGTQQLFFFAPLLRQAFESGKVLIIDELDSSLHPIIVRFLVNLFRNKRINKSGAQIIFTTHETMVLSLDILRRDQIYFANKKSDTGATFLSTLEQFAVRKTENIEKGYLMGRYGAVPFSKEDSEL